MLNKRGHVLVVGHKGNLIFGKMGGKKVVCMQGRFHPYEHDMDLALVGCLFAAFLVAFPSKLLFI